MNLKFKDEIDFATFDNLIEEDANVVFMLSCLASNIKKKKLLGFLDSCFSFSNKYERKSHMFFLLLDLRVKTLYLVFSLVGHEQGKAIVEEYDSF
jgi:hypothetical protein